MTVSIIGVLVAAVLTMVIGYAWYGPLFGKLWMKEAGVTPSQSKNANGTTMYIVMFISALIEAWVLAQVLGAMDSITLMTAATSAFLVWLGFMATILVGSTLAEGRSWTYYAIVAGYQLVVVVVMSAVLVTL